MTQIEKEKAFFNWSGGKDSALALYKSLQDNKYQIDSLLTSISKEHQRVSLHGVRLDLLRKQAENIGIQLKIIEIDENSNMDSYEKMMSEAMEFYNHQNYKVSIFGDIFLEDLRQYRENKLSKHGFKGIFPLWNEDSHETIKSFIELGFKSIITCVNENYLNKSFVGRLIDQNFLNDLPKNVDPCGENGEYHSFVFDGPIFKKRIEFKTGEIILKKYPAPKNNSNNQKLSSYNFWFMDLIPL